MSGQTPRLNERPTTIQHRRHPGTPPFWREVEGVMSMVDVVLCWWLIHRRTHATNSLCNPESFVRFAPDLSSLTKFDRPERPPATGLVSRYLDLFERPWALP